MEIPSDISYWINEIKQGHDVWKAFYWACWNRGENLKIDCKDYDWNKSIVSLPLPASGEPPRPYTIRNLHKILTQSDHRIAVNHLIWMHLLIESLANKVKHIDGIKEPNGDLGDINVLSNFLIINSFMEKNDELDFKFSKYTRNQFVHGFSKYKKEWIDMSVLLKTKSYFEHDGTIHLDVQDCEKWQKIFEKIGLEIEKRYI